VEHAQQAKPHALLLLSHQVNKAASTISSFFAAIIRNFSLFALVYVGSDSDIFQAW